MDEQVRVAKKGDILIPVRCLDEGNYLVAKGGNGEEVCLLSFTQVEVMIPSEQLREKLLVRPELRLVDAYFDLIPLDEEVSEELFEAFRCFHTDAPLFSLDALESGIEITVIRLPDAHKFPKPILVSKKKKPVETEVLMVVAAAAGGRRPPWVK